MHISKHLKYKDTFWSTKQEIILLVLTVDISEVIGIPSSCKCASCPCYEVVCCCFLVVLSDKKGLCI